MKTGILLVNLGTPDSPHPNDVYRYLIEFLTDGRVIDLPWLIRQWLVRTVIVPRRYKASAKAYASIWTKEGSPLYVYGMKVKSALQQAMGDDFVVELAMRYQNPSIENMLAKMLKPEISDLIVLPLFPQFASATTGSVIEKVMESLKNRFTIPKVTFINQFAAHPAFIEAICKLANAYSLTDYDYFLFSYHGLPQRQIFKHDATQTCLKEADCCQSHPTCYSAQCYATTREVSNKLKLPKEKVGVAFQSRLGKEPWLKPYTNEKIVELAKQGYKKVLVFCPSFVCDCLETTYEIGLEYAEEFKHAGGDSLDLVQGLNDTTEWIYALKTILLENCSNRLR